MASIVEQIEREAIRWGISPDLAVALARVESGLRPSAVGDGGDSIGLFQIQPRWWDAWARRHGWNIRTVQGNIRAGVAILATMIRAEGGNVLAGLRRYNGGPAWESKPQTAAYARRVVNAIEDSYLIPVSGSYKITSPFGHRHRPEGDGDEQHTGVDLGGLKIGAPVLSARAGTITHAGKGPGGYGNLVIVRGTDGNEYYYGHLSSIHVSKGQRITRGTHLAGVGQSGRATGPHLHFEIRRDGKPIDPMFVFTKGTPINESQVLTAQPEDPPTIEDAVTRLVEPMSRVVDVPRDILAGLISDFAQSMVDQVSAASQQTAALTEQTQTAALQRLATPPSEFGQLAPALSFLREQFPDVEDAS